MKEEQSTLFDSRTYKGAKAQTQTIRPPEGDSTIHETLPAYHAYLSSGKYSQYTPDDYTGDLKRFGQFTGRKPLRDVENGDIQQYIGELKKQMPAKTVSRKVSAIGNYFRWLTAERVLAENPAATIRAERVKAPLPDILFDEECDRLLVAASTNPRTYLIIMLLLETGIKKAELMELKTAHFDFSNKYQPEMWVKHTGKMVIKDRRLKLPAIIKQVFDDYTEQHGITDILFPITTRTVDLLIGDARTAAKIQKKVTPGLLRDMFVVRSVKRGESLDDVLTKLGLAKSSFDDLRVKYGHLTSEAL